MQRAGKKNAAIQFDGLGFAENVDVSGILPDAVFPNGARDERVVITGNDVNWTREGAKDFADFANEEAVHGVVLKHVARQRSEEHTSELQSLRHLVCRLLLEKKK